MLARLRDWLDHRTGYRRVIEALLIEHIPGGAKWRYVWGSCLAFVFSIQLITGLLLMTAYSAGDSTAWASVFYIQYKMEFGWLIRGLHHFGSQTMVVLLGIHMLQVVIAGAHLPPREVNWWLGLGLLGCVMGLSLTGYLLPWDQKGYWATQVATNIAGNLPGLGPMIQKIVVGGPVYGHHTLTRFFALHVAVLPPLIVVLMIAHIAVFRRHGVTTPPNAQGEGWFWPDQAFRDMVVSMVVFGIMLTLVLWGHGHPIEGSAAGQAGAGAAPAPESMWHRMAHAGRHGLGANLDAPADPSRPYPARPEWYFLFLFQLLKYFEGDKEIIGTVVIPGVAGLVLFLAPLLGYGRMRRIGRVVGVALISTMLLGIGTMTYLAIASDKANTSEAQLLRAEQEQADKLAERSVQLADTGIPADGPISLLRRDPQTRGPVLFNEQCAGCHSFSPLVQSGDQASDLAGFGTEKWIRDLFRDPANPRFFGHTKLRKMAQWVKNTREKVTDDPEKLAQLESDLDGIASWMAGHPRGIPAEEDNSPFALGYRAFENRCMNCHTYEGEGGGDVAAPDFTGYGSIEWARVMVMAPDHPTRYGEKNAMPAFRNLEGPGSELTKLEFAEKGAKIKLIHLSDVDRELILRWLTGDGRVVFGGEPVSAPPKP
ncbi:MAG: cytochrome b N-terminal domain-containing protein [Planctomycetes bacterium]|nr:cytochrome b N-terminal domain-containing protein [Planctomycetota bacterium]